MQVDSTTDIGRRVFLERTAWAMTAAAVGGCSMAKVASAPGKASLVGFVAPKLEKIRVGVIGIGGGVKSFIEGKELDVFKEKYRSALWKNTGGTAKKVGGHGGMDYLMDLCWSHCIRNGLPLDMSVYDFATWSSIFELSERSVRNRSQAQDIPDFTRGAWKTTPPDTAMV